MVDLPADAGAGRGTFEELHEHRDARRTLAVPDPTTETTYGSAGRAWLEYLTGH